MLLIDDILTALSQILVTGFFPETDFIAILD